MAADSIPLVIVGSIGIDTIRTPFEQRNAILGGSASYACAAASFFTRTGMVGVVGTDFPEPYEKRYRDFGIDLKGLQKVEGETFRWAGEYKENMDERETLSTELNVFSSFSPDLPEAYCAAPFLFLANIGPALQQHVLNQMTEKPFVVMDTMDLWINIQRDQLIDVVRQVDVLTLNESEARRLTQQHFLPRAACELLALGPRYVLIKKGEHGSMLFSESSIFLLPAYPLNGVCDPTGAGDAFAGGLIGALAAGGDTSPSALRQAMLRGSVAASFAVEAFSLDRLDRLTEEELDARLEHYRSMLTL